MPNLKLAPIIWSKIANVVFETEGNGGGFLGKPYEPNAVVKNDIEFIKGAQKRLKREMSDLFSKSTIAIHPDVVNESQRKKRK